MKNSVYLIATKNQWNEVDQARYYQEKVNGRTLSEVALVKQFNREFDAWLDNVRLEKFYHAPEDCREKSDFKNPKAGSSDPVLSGSQQRFGLGED